MSTEASRRQEFRKAFADCVIPDIVVGYAWDKAIQEALGIRSLQWKGEQIPLAEAVDLFFNITAFEEFRPESFGRLQTEFCNLGIEVTPAREFSLTAYLHIPVLDVGKQPLRKRVERLVRERFGADEVTWEKDESLRIWWD